MIRDAIPDPMHLRIATRVNDETRQDGNTKDMIRSIPRLVAYLSQMTLMPGDIIATGSPGGTQCHVSRAGGSGAPWRPARKGAEQH